MGRAKILLSHTRDMRMEMTKKFIKYTIPLYSDKGAVGKVISTEIRDNDLIIICENKEGIEEKKAPEPNFTMVFS